MQLWELAARKQLKDQHAPVVAIGTTSTRALESAYWAGVQLISGCGDAAQGEVRAAPTCHQRSIGAVVRCTRPERIARRGEGIVVQVSIAQWAPYEMAAEAGGWENLPTAADALHAAARWAEQHGLDSLTGRTQLIITPGYRFQVCALAPQAGSGLVACAREGRAAGLLMDTATPHERTSATAHVNTAGGGGTAHQLPSAGVHAAVVGGGVFGRRAQGAHSSE